MAKTETSATRYGVNVAKKGLEILIMSSTVEHTAYGPYFFFHSLGNYVSHVFMDKFVKLFRYHLCFIPVHGSTTLIVTVCVFQSVLTE